MPRRRREETVSERRTRLTTEAQALTETVAAYERCLDDMRQRRSRYSAAIGALEAVLDDAQQRLANLTAKVECLCDEERQSEAGGEGVS